MFLRFTYLIVTGKLSQISPAGDGWDGTYNGQMMQLQTIGFYWNIMTLIRYENQNN